MTAILLQPKKIIMSKADQNNTELEAFHLICEARDLLAPIADKSDDDPTADKQISDIWDSIRKVKLELMHRLVVNGTLEVKEWTP